jgi:hypothetical protein
MPNSDRLTNVLDDARGRIALVKYASTEIQADEFAAEARGYIAALREQNLIERLQLVMLLAETDQALRDRRST